MFDWLLRRRKKQKKLRFLVGLTISRLNDVTFSQGRVFVKVKVPGNKNVFTKTKDITYDPATNSHVVIWSEPFTFEVTLKLNVETSTILPFVCRLSVREERKGGKSFERIGVALVDLAPLARQRKGTKRYMLHDSAINSILEVSFNMQQQSGDHCFRVQEDEELAGIDINEVSVEGDIEMCRSAGEKAGAAGQPGSVSSMSHRRSMSRDYNHHRQTSSLGGSESETSSRKNREIVQNILTSSVDGDEARDADSLRGRRRGAGGGSGGGAGHWHTDSDFSVEGAEFWTGGLDLVDHPPGSTNHSRSSSEKFPGGTSGGPFHSRGFSSSSSLNAVGGHGSGNPSSGATSGVFASPLSPPVKRPKGTTTSSAAVVQSLSPGVPSLVSSASGGVRGRLVGGVRGLNGGGESSSGPSSVEWEQSQNLDIAIPSPTRTPPPSTVSSMVGASVALSATEGHIQSFHAQERSVPSSSTCDVTTSGGSACTSYSGVHTSSTGSTSTYRKRVPS